MSDLIRREDAIKAVEQEYKIDRRYTADDYTYGFNQAIQYVSDIILQDLPSAEAVQGWIPCSERLPEKDGSYLVCMNWDYRNMDVLMWADGWNCIRLINDKVDRKSEIDGEKITAWMPLPIPYREEGE